MATKQKRRGRRSVQYSKKESKKAEGEPTDDASAPSSSAMQLTLTSTSNKPVSEYLNRKKLGKLSLRQETESSLKKLKKKERGAKLKRKTFSHLDLSNRYGIAGREEKQAAESSAVLSSSITSSTDETETSKRKKSTRTDAPKVTKEDKSTSKKKKRVKKCQVEPEKPLSYLDLSNRYAVAGRKVKKHRDGNDLKK
ncbi:hypothetical protein KIN20_009659, partial [Parelaphostrongylus tenuis]